MQRKQSWRIGHSDPGGRRSGNGNGAHEALTSSCSLPEPLISYGSTPAPVSALTSPAATGPKSRLFNASGLLCLTMPLTCTMSAILFAYGHSYHSLSKVFVQVE